MSEEIITELEKDLSPVRKNTEKNFKKKFSQEIIKDQEQTKDHEIVADQEIAAEQHKKEQPIKRKAVITSIVKKTTFVECDGNRYFIDGICGNVGDIIEI